MRKLPIAEKYHWRTLVSSPRTSFDPHGKQRNPMESHGQCPKNRVYLWFCHCMGLSMFLIKVYMWLGLFLHLDLDSVAQFPEYYRGNLSNVSIQNVCTQLSERLQLVEPPMPPSSHLYSLPVTMC